MVHFEDLKALGLLDVDPNKLTLTGDGTFSFLDDPIGELGTVQDSGNDRCNGIQCNNISQLNTNISQITNEDYQSISDLMHFPTDTYLENGSLKIETGT